MVAVIKAMEPISYISQDTLQNLDELKSKISGYKREPILTLHNQRYEALQQEALNTSLYIEYPEAIPTTAEGTSTPDKHHHSSRGSFGRDAKRLLRRLNTAWWYCLDNVGKDTLTQRDVEVIQGIIVPEGKLGWREHDITFTVPHEVEAPRHEDVPRYMRELFSEMKKRADTVHSVELAAYLHLHLLWIHPFSDGNGRSSRLVQNFLLHQAGYVPAIIKPYERWLYFSLLDEAKKGIIQDKTSYQRAFYEFIATKVYDGLEKVLESAGGGKQGKRK